MPKPKDLEPEWLQLRIIRCWHCACVVRFDDKREAGCLNCLCDFCPRLKSKQFFRIGSCLPGQGLYMWDGGRDVRIDGKKRSGCISSVSSGVRSSSLSGFSETEYFMFEKRQGSDREEKVETQLGYWFEFVLASATKFLKFSPLYSWGKS